MLYILLVTRVHKKKHLMNIKTFHFPIFLFLYIYIYIYIYNVFQIRYQVQQDIQQPSVGNSERMIAQVTTIDTTLLKCYIKVQYVCVHAVTHIYKLSILYLDML